MNEQFPIHASEQQIERYAYEAGQSMVRSDPRPLKVPGAILSPQSSLELAEELADIRRAEREGVVGGDNYYLGTPAQP